MSKSTTKIIFASNNAKKLLEVKSIFSGLPSIQVLSLNQAGINIEIPEDHETLEENAIQKAHFIFQQTQTPCIADDSGLEIAALNGAPGVYSARYAGMPCNDQKNIEKVLAALQHESNRMAQFRSVIAYVSESKQETFEGIIQGYISSLMQGNFGFGYDPIFIPNGYSKSFAQMTLEEKNAISHRKIALEKLRTFLLKNH